MQFNTGKFEGNKYIKKVSFSKAVLWKDRQISLHPSIYGQFKERGTQYVVFEDEGKNERWTASVEKLEASKILKTEGQEEQFYFPISIFKDSAIRAEDKPKPKPTSVSNDLEALFKSFRPQFGNETHIQIIKQYNDIKRLYGLKNPPTAKIEEREGWLKAQLENQLKNL